MPGPVHATPDGMRECATILGRYIETIGNIRTAVAATGETLLRTWTGRAALVFGAAMGRWDKEMADILLAMRWLQDNMTKGGTFYADSEESVRRAIEQLEAGLNTVGPAGPTSMTGGPLFKS